MFIGARVSLSSGTLLQAGVVISISNLIKIRLDNDTTIDVNRDNLELINSWKTWKKPKDIGSFKTYPPTISPLMIYTSKKPIIFGTAGMRSCFYWANDVIFGNKLKEPKFILTSSRTKAGSYTTVKRELRLSSINHSMLDFSNTMAHEMIHMMNKEVEYSPTDIEGYHGASFRRWIPIIKEKTGLIIKADSLLSDDVTDFTDVRKEDEEKTSEFIFLLFKVHNWYCIKLDIRQNLPLLLGQVYSLINKNGGDTDYIYAGKSTSTRVLRETLSSKDGRLPKLKLGFSPSLVNLLAKTCSPIVGYRVPKEIELKS